VELEKKGGSPLLIHRKAHAFWRFQSGRGSRKRRHRAVFLSDQNDFAGGGADRVGEGKKRVSRAKKLGKRKKSDHSKRNRRLSGRRLKEKRSGAMVSAEREIDGPRKTPGRGGRRKRALLKRGESPSPKVGKRGQPIVVLQGKGREKARARAKSFRF